MLRQPGHLVIYMAGGGSMLLTTDLDRTLFAMNHLTPHPQPQAGCLCEAEKRMIHRIENVQAVEVCDVTKEVDSKSLMIYDQAPIRQENPSLD